jgi:hypothetical protein
MIALSTHVYDLLGHVILRDLPSSELHEVTRRVGRAKTLDGGVAINDGGHSHGDRTFRVRWRIMDNDQRVQVERLTRLYPLLTVTTMDGVFRAAPQTFTTRGTEGVLTLLVSESLL